MPRTPPARRPRHAGFTLAEVLVTTVIVGTAFMALGWMMTSANRAQTVYQAASVDDLQIAREIHEFALAVRHEPFNGNGPALTAADVLALDNLDGASFSPPIRADGTSMPHLTGWTQRVDLTQHLLADLKQPKLAQIEKPGKGVAEVYKLTVTVLEGTTEKGVHAWILKP